MPSASASWGFQPGTTIGEGRAALKALGGGTRYEVWLVWDELLFSLAVAKLLRPDQAGEERALRDMRREAEALAALAHPVLVRCFDAVFEGPHPHLLIEHFEGPSLRSLIRRGGALPLEQSLPLALHVASALQYMARMGYVHLDVKPDNIIMGVPPALIDLSIARTFERAGRIADLVGTDAYMPPEQCDPAAYEGRIGSPADVWGLGATLHHALSGSRPFPREDATGDSEDAVARFPQLTENPEPLPERLPVSLRELIDAMLAKDPATRPTAAEVAERLEPLVGALPRRMVLGRRGVRPI